MVTIVSLKNSWLLPTIGVNWVSKCLFTYLVSSRGPWFLSEAPISRTFSPVRTRSFQLSSHPDIVIILSQILLECLQFLTDY